MRVLCPSMAPTPEDWLARARAGEAGALAALWTAERDFVAAVLWAHVPREGELDDLLQEVAVALVRHLHELRDLGAFRSWLRAVALNAARSALRQREVRRHLGALPDHDEPPDPRCALARADLQDEVRAVLARIDALPSDLREALVLRAVRGLTQQQIADALGVPETTVETRLARARRLLRDGSGEDAPAAANGSNRRTTP